MSQPLFAVVGHPNKGKSSIVATLVQDDSVRIAPDPGTTDVCGRYLMKPDEEVLYTLVDTPGFQRARHALAWMKDRETTSADHPRVVRAFVETHRASGEFSDECELLTPVLEGAGILYVVDGSVPFGEEYEAEMEILRWTGQPSMALINPIGSEDHVDEWTAALGQYFKVVRVFNAVTAEFEKRLQLLRAFGQLEESWRRPLDRAVASLEADRDERRADGAAAIGEMLADMLTLTLVRKLGIDEDAEPHKPALDREFKDRLRGREKAGREDVERIYAHHKIERHERDFELIDNDLFSQQSWLRFGLTRRQLLGTGAVGGAIVGGGIDAAVAGGSFLLGTAIGAVVGGTSAWWSYDRIARAKVMGLPLGGRELRMGPTHNRNFPYVVLGRALHHHDLIAGRTHAQRGELNLDAGGQSGSAAIPPDHRRAIERCFTRLRRSDDGVAVADIADELAKCIEALMRDQDAED